MLSRFEIASIEEYRRVFDILPNPVFVKDELHRFVAVNDMLCRFLGRRREELIGRTDLDFHPAHLAEEFFRNDDEVMRWGVTNEAEEIVTDADNVKHVMLTRKSRIDMDNGRRLLVGVMSDMTRYRQAEAQIRHMAHHDVLTGLPNRTLFLQMVDRALVRAVAADDTLAVLLLDLDNFKEVNDLQGHPAGDALLCEVGQRLMPIVRRRDIVARLGGDEFAILLRGVSSVTVAEQAASRIVETLSRPFEAKAAPLTVGVSIGIACFPTDAMDAENLLRCADIALNRAKQEGRGRTCVFVPTMDQELRQRRQREIDLRAALAVDDQLFLHYQPQFDLARGTLVGFEALVRWRHPTQGTISPGDFIPLAEETGLIVPLGEWALRRACRDAMDWPRGTIVSVNVSAVQFRRQDFVETVAGALEETGLEATSLELEITESVIMQDTTSSLLIVERLRRLGVGIAMDDFGTGYSSLGNLLRFPFGKIKIDRSLINGIGQDGEAAAIVGATLSMGRSLHMVTTAEGIETKAQLARLTELGCDQAQGFLCGRPVAAEKVLEALARPEVGRSLQGWIELTSAGTTKPVRPSQVSGPKTTSGALDA